MKRFLLYLLTIAAFVACSKGEDEGNDNSEPTPEKPKTEIKIETSTSDFTTEGGDNTISFTTNEAWTAQVINSRADDWCKINPTSGSAGNATITVTTTPNDTPDDRTASIIIKAGAVSKTVTVSQKQKDALTITASKFEVAAAGGEVAIEVKANIDFEYVIDDDAKEWISYEGTRALKTSKLAFKIAENDDIEKREGKIAIKSGEFNEVVTIYQAGDEPTIVISKNEYVVSSDGETVAVEVTSNVDVAVEMPVDVDWISESTTRATSTNTYYFDIQPNENYDQRTAEIKFTNKENGLSETVKVVQTQKDALVVAKESYTVDSDGGQIQIEIGHNVDFDIEIANDWITKVDTRAFVTETLVFNIAKHTGYDNREGTIIFKSKDGKLTQTVKVYQAQEDALIISKKDIVVSDEGGTISFELQTNVEFKVSDPNVDWLRAITTRGLATHTLSYTVDANTSYDSREAKIVVTDTKNNKSETITITQAQKDAIVLAKDSYTVSSYGDQIEIEIGHNVDFDIEIANDWITKVDTRAFVTETLVFNIAKHTGYDNREGTIVFKSKDGKLSQTVKVYQAQEDALIISKKDIVVSDEGGTISFELQTNVEFKVSAPNVDWLRAITTRGLATHTLSYTVDANTSYDSREAKIVVTDTKNNKSETITITQAQKDAIVLAKSEYEFGVDGGNLDFEIQTNVDITVTISDNAKDWIQQVETRALETKALYFNVAACSAEEDREGTITISGGNATQTIKVKQIAKVEINPNDVPDNEIWYRTTDNQKYDIYHCTNSYGHQPFDASIVSHTYENGIGKIICDKVITKINESAFGNGWCHKLSELYLPETIETIGTYGIRGNSYLTTLRIPKNLKLVGAGGLNNPNLESFTGFHITEDGRCVIIEDGFMPNYGNTIVPVKNYIAAFAPAGITEYALPSNVEILGWYAFAWCPELPKITFNEGLKTIMGDCFFESHLECEIIFPSTLENLDPYAFHSCSGIKGFYGNEKFHTSDNLCLIFEQTTFCDEPEKNGKWINRFVGYDITDYSIPEGIVGVENYSFDKMPNLKTVTLPSSLVEVGAYAFNYCVNLEALYGECVSDDHKAIVFDTHFRKLVITKGVVNYTIPDEITSIGYCAFTESPEIETITMGDQVTTIDGYAFARCPNLKSITLSAGLKDISGYNAFLGSDKLETIYCRALVPPSYYDTQMSEFPNLKFYVPEQSLAFYQNNAGWAPFKKYFIGYNYTDLPEIDTYISSDYSNDGKVATLQTATKGNGIDIVLMGDAYSDRQIADGTYKTDMENMYNNLFTEEPYKSFKDHFNVHYVNVVSATEGYEHSGAALGGYFGDGTLVGGNDNAVFNYALKAISEEEMDEAMLIVAMNSDNYAGTCYMYHPGTNADYGKGVSVSYFPNGGNAETFAQLLHHEACGHGFAKLADEYAYEYMGAIPESSVTSHQSQQANWGWWKNVDFTSDPTKVRWNYFLTDTRYANDGLGAFEGGLTYWTGVWRPTENSIMRYNTGGFNAPSREAIYYRIHKLAYGEDWQYDYEKFVEWDAKNRKTAAATRGVPYKSTSYKPTHPPVVINKSWRDAK